VGTLEKEGKQRRSRSQKSDVRSETELLKLGLMYLRESIHAKGICFDALDTLVVLRFAVQGRSKRNMRML
jgi:hypothetical protein